jgi:hypothetical protein
MTVTGGGAVTASFAARQPERPDFYTPRQSFEDELTKIAESQKPRDEYKMSARLVASVSGSGAPIKVPD